MMERTASKTRLIRATLALCAILFASFPAPLFAQNDSGGSGGHIAKVIDDDGRRFFINAEPLLTPKLNASKPRTNIYMPAESSLTGRNRPEIEIGRDGVERLVSAASD